MGEGRKRVPEGVEGDPERKSNLFAFVGENNDSPFTESQKTPRDALSVTLSRATSFAQVPIIYHHPTAATP